LAFAVDLVQFIITGLFQATRPIANTDNTKLHKKTTTRTQTYIHGK